MNFSDEEWAKKWRPLVPIVSDKLFPLAEQRYERVSDLLEHKLTVFQITEQYDIELSVDDSDIEEQHRYQIEWAKHQMSLWTYRRNEFEEELERRRRLRESTGKPWVEGFTNIQRRAIRVARESPEEAHGRARKFQILTDQLWKREVEVFSQGEYKRFEPETLKLRKTLIKSLLGHHSADLGYHYNKQYSTSKLYTYTKRLSQHWLLYFATDMSELRDPRAVTDRHTVKINAGVVGSSTNAKSIMNAHRQPVLPLEFEWFFPIRTGFALIDYRSFKSLQELEAIVNINLTLYRIIADEIERAVIEGILEIKAHN